MSRSDEWTRRRFLQSSTAAASAKATLSRAGASPTSPGGPIGSNDTIRLGLIGCGPQGMKDLIRCQQAGKTRAVALCDVDQARLQRAVKQLGETPDIYGNFRRVIERKDIDAVIVATPDHWHAIQTLEAIRAGKDVYLEKPVGHTVQEGQQMVKVARQHDVILEVGLQQRSGTIFQEAVELVQSGRIGKVSRVHCINAWGTSPSGQGRSQLLEKHPDGPAPETVDYDMWLGPAPKRPFNPNRFHGNYVYFWDYSGGMVAAWGVHLLDLALWAMGGTPTGITTSGGTFALDDARETPDTAEVLFDFPHYTLSYSCRHASGFPMGNPRGDHGIQFLGDQAALLVDRDGYQIIPEGESAQPQASPSHLDNGLGTHQQGFIERIRSRQAPVCSIEAGHLATTLCQLANISCWTGRKIFWDAAKERIINDPEASGYLAKEYRAPWLLD